MNHKTGYKVTIRTTERMTITRSIKREITIAPAEANKKSTKTEGAVNVLAAVSVDAGNHKA